MQRLFPIGLFICLALSSKAQTPADDSKVLQVQNATHDFGSIPQGKPVTYQYVMYNRTADTIRLQHVEASCGCTTPHWSAKPVPPGDSTLLPVTYNAAGDGIFTKAITLFYTNNLHQLLYIKGEVWKTPDTSVPLNTGIQLVKQ
jgi:hypothetical protein